MYEFTLTNLQLQDSGKKFVYSTDLRDDQGNTITGSEEVTVLGKFVYSTDLSYGQENAAQGMRLSLTEGS